MQKLKDEWLYRYWILPAPPPGASLWCFKLVHFISPGGFRSVQFPSGITLRLILRGTGWVEVAGRMQPAGAGALFCAVPGMLIRMGDSIEDPWEWQELQVTGESALAYIGSFGIDREHPLMQVRGWAAAAVFRRMVAYYVRPDRDPYFALSMLYEFAHACVPGHRETGFSDRRQGLVSEAQLLLESQLELDFNVNGIARQLGVDRTTLLRAFRQYLNQTPLEYLQKCRLRRARELLASTDLPVRQVAQYSGFRNDKYFISSFKKDCGLSPGAWRNEKR